MCVMVGHAFSQAARESVRRLLPSPLLHANPVSHPRATVKGSVLSLTLLSGIYLCTPVHSTPTANVWNPFGAPPNKFLGVRITVEWSPHRQPLPSPPDPSPGSGLLWLKHWGWGLVGNQKRVYNKE